MAGHALPVAFRCREKDHRHGMVGTAVLWVEAEPASKPNRHVKSRTHPVSPATAAMTRTEAGRRRCAIYTRKSSEEGLEQDFNSLAAQREACEAYIRSQQHEGWVLAGGNLDRPALQHLL